jgi:hypothetical protein
VRNLVGVAKFRLLMGMLSLLVGLGCGSGGGSPVLIHTTGNFSTASLKGSYVFQIHGTFVDPNTGACCVPYRQVGVFTADGNGNITAGTDDSNSVAGAIGGTAITGTYSVISSGAGTLTFGSSSVGPINLQIVLVSSSQVQLIEADANVNAAGTAELQDPNTVATTPNGTLVFRLHQENSAQNSSEEAAQVGAIALTGRTGSGSMDQNLNGTLTSPNITAAFSAPSNVGRGTATITDSSGTTNLVYYVVSGTELALLVDSNLNPGAVGSGSAEAQNNVASGTTLSGSYAFGSRGDDIATGFLQGLAAVGQFTAANGAISGEQDSMFDGTYTPATGNNISACYAASSPNGINGRVAVVPCQSQSPTQVFWIVSPSRAFFLDILTGELQDGTADLQTANSFSASSFDGQFVLVMDGVDFNNQAFLSRIGDLEFDGSGTLQLSEMTNELNGISSPGGLSGQYHVSSNGRVVGTVSNNGNPPLDVAMYAVSGSKAYVMQGDVGFTTSGTVTQQQH